MKKQCSQKPGTARGAHDSRFSQRFQVIVVRMVDNFCVVQALVGREDGLQSAKSGARPGMFAENVPGVRAHGGALSGSHFERLHGREAFKDLPGAQPRNEHECKEQDHRSGKHMLSACATQNQQQRKKAKLVSETDDASAGGGEEKGPQGQERQEADGEPTVAAHLSENERNQSDGNDEFGKPGEMIAVHVRAKGNSAVAHLAKPVEFAVKGQMLKDAKDGDKKTKPHDEPHEKAPVVRGAKCLSGQKKKESDSREELELHAGVVGRSGATKEKLPQRKEDQGEQRRH